MQQVWWNLQFPATKGLRMWFHMLRILLTAPSSQKENSLSGSTGYRREQVTAIAVRQHETKKNSPILRYLYAASSSITESIETWIAISRFKIEDRIVILSLNESTNTDKYFVQK